MLRLPRQKTRSLARASLASLLGITLIATISACAPAAEQPRQLSTAEAELLSAARFHNFDAGTRRIDMTITESGTTLDVTGYYDFVSHVGFAEVASDAQPSTQASETDYLWWTATAVGEVVTDGPAPDWDAGVPTVDPAWSWEFFEIDPKASTLIAGLALVSASGFDRPDNPQLLAQSDALWLSETSKGVWFQLPSSDDLTKTDPTPSANPALPRMLVSDSGVIQRVKLDPTPTTDVSITFGSSTDSTLPAPSIPAAEQPQ